MRIFVLALMHAAIAAVTAKLSISGIESLLAPAGVQGTGTWTVIVLVVGALVAYAVAPFSLKVFAHRIAPLEIPEFSYTAGVGLFVLLFVISGSFDIANVIPFALISYVFFHSTGTALRN